MRSAVLASLLLLLCATTAMATTVTLTMNEVATQPINGLTVTKSGVSFTFTELTGALFYNSGGPGNVTFVQDPSIQGPLRPFSVLFSEPVNFIQFGLVEGVSPPVPLTGASVTLSNGNVLPFSLPLVDPFPEGQFTYSGVPVIGFLLTPAPGAQAMAFDNLTVNTLTVPEPASVSFLLAAIFAATLLGWRRLPIRAAQRN
jgi:hypothetical protein